jgi:hypothetical protein
MPMFSNRASACGACDYWEEKGKGVKGNMKLEIALVTNDGEERNGSKVGGYAP